MVRKSPVGCYSLPTSLSKMEALGNPLIRIHTSAELGMNFRNRCRKLWGSSKSNELPQGRLFTLEGLAFQDKSSRSREIRGACGTLYSLTSRINVCSFRFCFP